ncbi:poly-gamma-glutamate system protein [Leptospira sp. WS92.C1]
MKEWIVSNRSHLSIFLLFITSLSFWVFVEFWPVLEPAFDSEVKLKASRFAETAFQKIREIRIAKGLGLDSKLDPGLSGLIGMEISSVTSSAGKLSSKQASVHPDFAAWFVDQFQKAGLQKGDWISAGISGSFPALNIAFFTAVDAMELKVVVIASVSSSQYGANVPGLLWPDMENRLYQEGLIQQRTSFMTTGGIDDQGIGIGKNGLSVIQTSILKNGYPYLSSNSFEDSINQRLGIYKKKNVRLYVNIGGGSVSTGTSLGKRKIPKGLVFFGEEFSELPDSILKFYLESKIPVIHVIGIESISEESGMYYKVGEIPKPGTSNLIVSKKYDRKLAGIFVVLLLFLIWKLSFYIELSGKQEPDSIRL